MKARKLAVLVPVFNGGEQLLRSVESCALAALRSDQYELIVVDNCSTDGAVERLPSSDEQGALVQRHFNPVNLGRVGNWNRAVSIAAEQGFGFATFLFVGDSWLPGPALNALLTAMSDCDAAIGFSSFIVADESGTPARLSDRFYTAGADCRITAPIRFLTTLLECGLFPLGPLQANVYRLGGNHRLQFESDLPSRTDVEATLRFVMASQGPVVVSSLPFLKWREHKARFHASMGTAKTVSDYLDTFHSACRQANIPVNHGRSKAGILLNSLRLMLHDEPSSRWLAIMSEIAKLMKASPYRTSALDIASALYSRYVLGRRMLEFSGR